MGAYEAKLTVTISALPSEKKANQLNEEIMSLLLDLYGEGIGDLVIGAETIEYDPDEE